MDLIWTSYRGDTTESPHWPEKEQAVNRITLENLARPDEGGGYIR